jgi:heat shock protein HslJ
MFKVCAPLMACAALATPALAQHPLMCFGNEPSWSVDLTTPGVATAQVLGEEATTYRGTATRNDVLKEAMWRGSPGAGRDLVVFLIDKACSDQMSDVVHPVTARVSFPDGRFFAGCCRVVAAGAGGSVAKPLDGTVWQLERLPGTDAGALGAARQPITMRLEGGRVSGSSGCNRIVGSYRVEGDVLTLSQLAGTMMACPEPAASLEKAFRAALAGPLRYSIGGDRLTLTPASGEPLVFVAEVQALDGDWQVNGFNNGRDAVVGLKGDAPVTLSFKAGTVSGDAGCNTFRGGYTVDGKAVKIGPLALTRKACGEEAMQQERAFVAALESAATWAVEGGTLDMHRADGQRAVMARRTPRPQQ